MQCEERPRLKDRKQKKKEIYLEDRKYQTETNK